MAWCSGWLCSCTVESKATENCWTPPFLLGDIQWCSILYTAIGFHKIHGTGVSFEGSPTFSNFVEITKNINSGRLAKCRQKAFSYKPISLGDQAEKDAVELTRVHRIAAGKTGCGKCVSQWASVWFMQEKLQSGWNQSVHDVQMGVLLVISSYHSNTSGWKQKANLVRKEVVKHRIPPSPLRSLISEVFPVEHCKDVFIIDSSLN